MKRVLVTGGAGFLGSHLCRSLIGRGDEVLCMDNLSTGLLGNIAPLIEGPRFRFIEADVCEPIDLPGPLDLIAHLACPASPPDYLRLPIETLAIGGIGSSHLLEFAGSRRARIVLASTSEVYGDPLVSPQTEAYWGNVNPIGPRSVYDESKRFAEAMFMAHRRERGTDAAIVRIFNTYGPGLRPQDGRVVSNFVAQALDGHPLTVYGDGLQTRSFCFVDDLIRGIVLMLDSEVSGPVNLGNPVEMTILDLAALIIDMTGSPSGVEFSPLPVDDPTCRRPDITLAASSLNWRPMVGPHEGLTRTIEWQRSLPVLSGAQ